MPYLTLYAYVVGADLEDVVSNFSQRLALFIASRHWIAGSIFIVNQRHGEETCSQQGDLPLWDLRINLELPSVGAEPPGWFADVEAIALFLGVLHKESGRDFIIGIADAVSGMTEDLFADATELPDLVRLRAIIGVRETEKGSPPERRKSI